MKAKRKIYLFVYTLLFTVCLILLMTIMWCKTTSFTERKILYSSLAVELKNFSEDKDFVREINKESFGSILIIKNVSLDGMDVRGIYFQQDGAKEILLSKGRFFTEKECLGLNKVAVIGHEISQNVYSIKEKDFIALNGNEFEVVGYLEHGKNISLKNSIFLPMGILLKMTGNKGEYAIDGDKPIDVKRVVEHIQNSDIEVNVLYPATIKKSVLSAFFDRSNEVTHLYLIILFFLVLFFAKGISYWYEYRKEEYKVYKDIGIKDFFVLCEGCKQYLIVVFPAILGGCFFVWIALRILDINVIHLRMWLGYIGMIVVLCLIIIVSIFVTIFKNKEW